MYSTGITITITALLGELVPVCESAEGSEKYVNQQRGISKNT